VSEILSDETGEVIARTIGVRVVTVIDPAGTVSVRVVTVSGEAGTVTARATRVIGHAGTVIGPTVTVIGRAAMATVRVATVSAPGAMVPGPAARMTDRAARTIVVLRAARAAAVPVAAGEATGAVRSASSRRRSACSILCVRSVRNTMILGSRTRYKRETFRPELEMNSRRFRPKPRNE